jgi:pilus assembly protein CpaE
MTQPLTLVVLSTALDSFKEIRAALASDSRAQLLAGGNDADQVYEEIVRLKPSAAIIALGSNADHAIKLIGRLSTECPGTALISAAKNASGDLILQSLRAGAREFLNLPIKPEELKTVFDRITDFSVAHVETPKKRGRMLAVFSSKSTRL